MSIHPTADVSSECQVGPGTLIWHHAQVRERAAIGATRIPGKGVYVDADVTIGNNCKLQNGVSVFRSAVLEDGVFLGPGVIITNDRRPRAINVDGTLKQADGWEAARVVIRVGAAVGAGSVVLVGVTVGRWAMIGAGSTVTRDVPEHALAVGSPARVIGYVCACGKRLDDASDRVCGTCPEPLTGQL